MCDVLISLYPNSSSTWPVEARDRFVAVYPKVSLPDAARWGRAVAKVFIDDRATDGAVGPPKSVPAPPDGKPYEHRPDPTVVPRQMLHAPHWGRVRPFLFQSEIFSSVAELPPPLSLDYVKTFKEVKQLGEKHSTDRSDEQTETGIFWAYDGAYLIGTPDRLYSLAIDAMIDAAPSHGSIGPAHSAMSGFKLAKLYAVTKAAMADAAIAAWREKYRRGPRSPADGCLCGCHGSSISSCPHTSV